MEKSAKQRLLIIDVLRGFAVCGILFANINWINGFYLSPADSQAFYASGFFNETLLFLSDVFTKNKSYTLFSFLFGLGFSILLSSSLRLNHPHFTRYYIIRLGILFIIGTLHAAFFWFGDILRLYAIVGCFMLLFIPLSNKNLLRAAFISLTIPFFIGILNSLELYYFDPAIFISYSPQETVQILQQGPWDAFLHSNFERVLYHITDNLFSKRFFKILGLFLLGLYVGRSGILTQLTGYMPKIKRLLPWAWLFSISTNLLYVKYVGDENRNPALTEFIYLFSVYPLVFTYVITIIYGFRNIMQSKVAQYFSAAGRMALTNYLGQTVLLNLIVLWYGLGLAAQLSMSVYFAIGLGILLFQFIFSYFWLKHFPYGPMEYAWREATNWIDKR